jgi:hypothetical protein
VAELFEHRHLFVGHHLSAAQRQLLHKLTPGLPQLRTLREIMEEVYRLFDRRCKTQTALKKLERLRRRVRRFKKLGKGLNKPKSPTPEKALVFLDDRLLGVTSNAVERANRRFRKAQQSIYSVRTKEHVEQRLALDMQREQRTPKRQQTAETLHRARSKPGSLHETCYSVLRIWCFPFLDRTRSQAAAPSWRSAAQSSVPPPLRCAQAAGSRPGQGMTFSWRC